MLPEYRCGRILFAMKEFFAILLLAFAAVAQAAPATCPKSISPAVEEGHGVRSCLLPFPVSHRWNDA